MNKGDVIAGRFEIERFVARGGMADVYRARDRVSGERVALKLVTLDEAASEQRVALEARALAELRHPAIVRYVAHDRDPKHGLFLVMEWLEGVNLATRLKRAPLTVEESLELTARVADGLGVAHAAGMIHRDVKPLNIFLVNEEIARVKILDFGIVRIGALPPLTSPGVGMGTPHYMAPEQARGERSIGPQADVFALGGVLYRCLTGRNAYGGKQLEAVLAKIAMAAEAPRVSEVLPRVAPDVDDLVAGMMAAEPGKRPPDGAAAAAYIRAVGRALAMGHEATLQVEPAPSLTDREIHPVAVIFADLELEEADTLPSAVVDVKQLAAFADPIQAGSEPSANSLDNVLRVMRASERAPELRPAIQDALEPYGAAVELLLNGSVVAVISGGAAPTDLAVRTARAALALRSCLDDASVGVASGRAIKGERKAIGPLIDTAAALVLSRSRAIRIDATTRELLPERFDVHEDQAGWFELRAEREPETEAREPSRLLLGKPTPCVGRKRIIGQLAAAFDGCVEDSEAHAVLVIGAAGVGKSRVRAELVERLRGESAPPSVISGFGDPLRAQTPYALLGRALFRYLGIRDSDEGARLEAVRARAGRHLSVEDAAVVPAFLGALMGVNFPDEDLPALRAARADPVFMADRVAWAWTTWLEAECAANPVLLIIDDLQWADAPTVELIAETLRSTREQPLMVLALARPAVEDRFPTLRDSWRHQRIDLAPLRPAACAQLAREFLGDGASEELIDQVVRRSEGNAFYLEELIRTAASGGADAPSDTVIASIQLRVSRLPGQARQILRAASVFGQAFWAGGVAALLEGRVSRSEVEDWLAELTQQELIARAGNTSGFAGETGHSFRHDLLREAVYGMLPEADRVAGHRLAGKWLREQGERDPAVLAEHFAGGGAAEQAVAWFEKAAEKALAELGHEGEVAALRRAATYCRRAGETAAKAYANENAILFFERAAALFDLLDPVEAARTRIELSKVREHVGQREEAIRDVERGRETIAGVEGVQQVEVDLLIRLGTLEMRSHKEGALERAERIARESRELASSVGARQREAAALTLLANVLCRYESDESSKKAVAYAERALTLCKEPGAIAESLFTLGNALVMCNQHARADSVYRKAFAAAEAINSEGLMASCLGNRGVASFRRWELGAAIDQCERSLGLFRLIGHRRRIVEGTHNLGAYRLVVGETADAKRLVEAALADAGGDWVIASYCNETLATIARNEGDEQRAQELLREGVVLCERAGVAERQALFLGLLAESLWTTGEVQEAIDSLERAVATGAGVSLSHALLMARMGELQDALAWFQQFMEEDPDPHRRMIATMAAVRASWALGRLGEARAACRAAIEILRPANARPLLTQAETLMACLEGVAARAVDCYLQARIHCGRGVIAEVALDVATCLHDATDDLDADMIRRFLDESADIEDCGLRYRLEDLRAGLFERLGEAELARVALGNARSGVQALLEQMPVEHRAMFEAHPWVRAIMRVRLTP